MMWPRHNLGQPKSATSWGVALKSPMMMEEKLLLLNSFMVHIDFQKLHRATKGLSIVLYRLFLVLYGNIDYRVKQTQIETEVFTIYVGGLVIH